MDIKEYEKVMKLNYQEYSNYLQKKYGLPKANYFTSNWSPVQRIKRTKDGLVIHHIMEDRAIMLGNKKFASQCPYEWQYPNNLVYCDLLEHMLLHILICENPHVDKKQNQAVGFGGIINFLVPELNDVYSGWISKEEWRLNTHKLIINNQDVYFELLKRFKKHFPKYEQYLCRSFSDISLKPNILHWTRENDKELFLKIKDL